MQPSDALPPSATAPVPLARGLPRCRRLFCARWPTTRAPANASCVGDHSPALRKAGMGRGEARASQVPGPSSSCVPWSNTPPDTLPSSPKKLSPGMVVAFRENRTLGIREGRGFGAAFPWPTCSHAYASPTPFLRPSPGSLPAWAGSPLARRALHPLDDAQSFMKASPPPIPFDQPCLVALFYLLCCRCCQASLHMFFPPFWTRCGTRPRLLWCLPTVWAPRISHD